MNLTVIIENSVRKRGLLAEHGLSFLIETEQQKILFDTGQGMVLENNMAKLGFPLNELDAIVLSHGHYDHTAGLAIALQSARRPRLYAHPDAFEPKFSQNPDGSARDVGMSIQDKQAAHKKADLIWVEGKTEIDNGVYLTGPIPRITEYEDTGGAFFRDPACKTPDELLDDQAAFIETEKGTVVILGCAHSGVINTLRYIQKLTSGRPIHTMIGGMHLLHANPFRMKQTLAELHRFNIQCMIPCHCTGFAATVQLWAEFPEKCEPCSVGTVLKIKD